jgi:hypothetical protein
MADLKPGRTDRQTLSALLLCGKLGTSEERAFRSMYDSLETGQIKLTPSQRMWADQVYDKLQLDKKPPPVLKKTIEARGVPSNHPFDEMVKNRPLKPPGRK